MPKGMYTQGVCVLLERAVNLDELEAVLSDFKIAKRLDANEAWAFGGPSLVLSFLPESNGYASVDIVDRKWPDHMGDPKNETMIFGAWTMGNFGPFAYPGGLARAAQQSWAWEAGQTMPDKHNAFIRIRTSYVFGAGDDDPVIPNNYEPLPELEFVSDVALAALNLPGALCYFNPSGEMLRDRDGLRETLDHDRANDIPPLDAWSNIRMYNVNPEWSLMDTVGNSQLDIPDTEVCFHVDSYDPNEMDNFLRNVSLYILNNGEVIKDGDTMGGPGDIDWQAHHFENGLSDPPRRVLRFLPLDDRPVPPEIANAGKE